MDYYVQTKASEGIINVRVISRENKNKLDKSIPQTEVRKKNVQGMRTTKSQENYPRKPRQGHSSESPPTSSIDNTTPYDTLLETSFS